MRRYPLFRAGIVVLIIAAIYGTIYLVNKKTKPIPEIESINPPVGSPGDVVLIKGKNFGDVRDMSYVEIAGSKLTATSYISWSDNSIKIVLPANIQDGLVVIGTKDMRSRPALFANEVDIPVPVQTVQQVSKPVIEYLSAEKVNIGDELVIQGSNFGDAKNQSKVFFTIDYNNKIEEADYKSQVLLSENMISCNEDEMDYISWSNTEIKVRVPDGACTGLVVVDTGKEKSNAKEITINRDAGKKTFTNKKIYLITYSADIADVVTNDISTITLRCPVPFKTASQPDVEITETNPTPVLMNYQNDLIHQITKSKSNAEKNIFTQTFVLPVFEVHSEINPAKIGAYKDTNKNLISKSVRPDGLVPSDNEDLRTLVKTIIGKETNAYRKAKLIYNYMLSNFEIRSEVRKNDADPLDLIKKMNGDAFDFAVIYTALARAAEIPALTDSGVLIGSDLSTQAHWWCEIYIDRVGWLPVDPALGAGLEYKEWTDSGITSAADYYFGNLDSHHVTFSRGWNQLKPFTADNKIVQQPRSFALQSIWEEASENTVKYSSYWGTPVVKGVY